MFTRTITLAAICAALGRGGTPAIQLFQGWALLGGHCWVGIAGWALLELSQSAQAMARWGGER